MVRAVHVLSGPGWWVGDDELWVFASRFRDNMKRCSCPGCGNPRRHAGIPKVTQWGGKAVLTLGERRAVADTRDQVEEFLTEGLDLGEDND